MNQPHPPSPIPQQTATVLNLQQSCSHQRPRTVSNTSLSTSSTFSSSSLSTAAFDYSSCQYPFNTKKRRRSHNVRFASTSDLLIIPSKSSQDKQSSWYSEQDFTKFKGDVRSFSKAMEKSSCVDTFESIAYSLATKTATPLHHHVHPHEKILTRGVEHIVSPTVLKLLAHRRKVVMRRVLREQASLRKQLSGMNKRELECRMTEELAQCSMAGSEFAKGWAVLKLLHHQG